MSALSPAVVAMPERTTETTPIIAGDPAMPEDQLLDVGVPKRSGSRNAARV
jgi:hypothetical protein